MQQLTLDWGQGSLPSLDNFAGQANAPVLAQLRQWLLVLNKQSESAQGGGQGWEQKRGWSSLAPIYLWGEGGLGKTHLLQALCHALHAHSGQAVGWMGAPSASSALAHETEIGKNAGTTYPPYQEAWAAVVLDDVQTYSPAQQHGAFTWCIHAQTQGVPILAAGTLPPTDLPLREDLRTRLAWGQVFALQAPTEEECRQALRQAAHGRGLVLGEELLGFILSRFSRNLGDLMALLNQMDAYALQTQRALTVPLLKAMLSN